jgi:hypothetical protein
MAKLKIQKENILFLDFDDTLNSLRSFYKKFAEHHGVTWTDEDFDPKYWGKGHPENMNPEFTTKVDKAWKEQQKLPGYRFPNLSCQFYPHDEIAIKNLNTIVEENQAKVVIDSCWRLGRTIEELQEILDKWGAKCKVVGRTPSRFKISATRGDEILKWIQENIGHIKGICIVDDSASYDINYIFKPWCVQDISGYTHGLREIHIAEAKKCFETPFSLKKILTH